MLANAQERNSRLQARLHGHSQDLARLNEKLADSGRALQEAGDLTRRVRLQLEDQVSRLEKDLRRSCQIADLRDQLERQGSAAASAATPTRFSSPAPSAAEEPYVKPSPMDEPFGSAAANGPTA